MIVIQHCNGEDCNIISNEKDYNIISNEKDYNIISKEECNIIRIE
jgi:cytochrome b involved in lipid metabolism